MTRTMCTNVEENKNSLCVRYDSLGLSSVWGTYDSSIGLLTVDFLVVVNAIVVTVVDTVVVVVVAVRIAF